MQHANHPPAPDIKGYSIANFNTTYINMTAPDNLPPPKYYKACILCLTGKDIHENIQYSIKPTCNNFQAAREVTIVFGHITIMYTHSSLWDPLQADRPLSPHHVPNIFLGAVGIHTKVRLFFPRLYDPDRKDVVLMFDEKKGLYEKVRHFGFNLAWTMAAAFPWAEQMLFMIQVQGVKDAHQHYLDDMDMTEDALVNALSDFHYDDLMEEEHCYVDVGLELSEPGQMLTTRILLKSHPVYFQAYTSDKALIQHKDGGQHGLALTGKAALADETLPYLSRLYALYFDAKDTHDCAARVEVHIQVKDAFTQALDFPAWLMIETLQWRCVCLQAIICTLRLQNQGPPELHFTSPALTLMAGLMWLANGLHSRPDDGSAAWDLMYAILPLTNDYDADGIQIVPQQHHIDNDDGLPFCAHGAFFLRDMVFPPVADVPHMTHMHPNKCWGHDGGTEITDLENIVGNNSAVGLQICWILAQEIERKRMRGTKSLPNQTDKCVPEAKKKPIGEGKEAIIISDNSDFPGWFKFVANVFASEAQNAGPVVFIWRKVRGLSHVDVVHMVGQDVGVWMLWFLWAENFVTFNEAVAI
ncbi:hypothetical protein EDB19DRAFT_1832449 [Suillus lakei]|nr:hypothetical protein EDB19DRAFT_1832449 [Suillus lakei]